MPEPDATVPRGPLPVFLADVGDDCVLSVRVIPRAGHTAFAGQRRGALLVRLAAAPVDGAANDALVAFLATSLGVPRRSLTLVTGDRHRDKRVRVTGLRAAEAARRLPPPD